MMSTKSLDIRLTVSQKVVTPLKNGVQGSHKCLTTLDSGFRRNDEKKAFPTCYKTIKID